MSTIGLIFLESTVLLAAAGLMVVAFRGQSASVRHSIWAFALGGVLLLPLGEFFLPKVELAVLPAPGLMSTSDGAEALAAYESPVERPLPAPSRAVDTPVPGSAEGLAAQPQALSEFADWLWGFWLAGALVLWGRLALGTWVIRRLARAAAPLDGGEWSDILSDLRNAMEIRRGVQLFQSPDTVPPMTWGVVQPVVLLPATAASWSEERRRFVLAHELAHVRRRDGLTHVLAQVAMGIYWFHPLVWYAIGRLRAEREQACDDLVLELGADAEDYAEHLVEVTRRLGSGVSFATLTMSRPSQLEARLLAILDPAARRQAISRFAIALLACAAAVLGLSTVSLRLTAAPPEEAAISEVAAATPRRESASEGVPVATLAPAPPAAPLPEVRQQPPLVQSNEPQTASVRGRVINLVTSAPMPDVPVTLVDSEGREVPGSTDSSGQFQIEAPPGGYTVRVSAPGFYRPRRTGGPVRMTAAPGGEYSLELGLSPLLSIGGRVLDDAGDPIPGAEVVAVQWGYDRLGNRVVNPCERSGGFRQLTDENGSYRLYDLVPGDYYLAVAGTGKCGFSPPPTYYPGVMHPSDATPITLSNDLTGIDVRVREAPLYEVRVGIALDSPGPNRVVAATLTLVSSAGGVNSIVDMAHAPGSGEVLPFAISGEELRIAPGLPPGSYTFYYLYSLFDNLAGVIEFDVVDSPVDAGTMRISDPVVLEGEVRGAVGTPMDFSGTRIVLHSLDGAGAARALIMDSVGGDGEIQLRGLRGGMVNEGRYQVELTGLAPDAYMASVRYDAADVLTDALSVEGDSEGFLDIVVDSPGGIVDGTVHDSEDDPVADAVVVVMPIGPGSDNASLYRTALTDQAGQFELRGVRPGEYQVLAWEDVPQWAWMSAGFRSRYQTRAERISIEALGRDTLDVEVIPAD